MKTNDILAERGLQPIALSEVDVGNIIEKSKESKLNCQICGKKKATLVSLWKHYICEHSVIRKQIAQQFDIDFKNSKCLECEQEMKTKLTRILHIGVVHSKLNDVLMFKGYQKLDIPTKFIQKSTNSSERRNEKSLKK